MTQPVSRPALESAHWFRAQTLSERAALWRARALPSAAQGEEASRSAHQLEQWRLQPPLDRGDWLAVRLASEGIDEAEFRHLLAARPASAHDTATAPWCAAISAAYDESDWETHGTSPWDVPEGNAASGFLALLRPLLRNARKRLSEGLDAILSPRADPFRDRDEADRLLGASLPPRLLSMADRTLVLELHVARLRGELTGSTPADRFGSFIQRLALPEAGLALMQEYPVLARQAVESIETWLQVSLELSARLRSDWKEVRATFFEGRTPGPVCRLRAGVGDSHRGGRSVAILEFESGAKLVYKPRPLAMDANFQRLLSWLSDRGAPDLRAFEVLDRGDYGWVEFVEAAPCRTPEEVRRYHERLGCLLAILYAVGAVDLHFENLIAAGDQPVAVDLETLMHPSPPRPRSERPDEQIAGRTLTESVLRVGLLPLRIGEGIEPPGADRSGVAAVGGQVSPDPMLLWEGSGTDEMRAAKGAPVMAGGVNRPTLSGEPVDVADHIPELVEGFERGYRLLVREREALLEPRGPLSWFEGVPSRIVLRATRAYGLLLDESWHPDFLRDALDRDRFFDRLWTIAEEVPRLARVIPHEHRDLWRGDIPLFRGRPGSKDLWTSGGDRIEAFLEEPPIDGVRRRLAAMGENDLLRQGWLARTSLGTLLLNRKSGEWPVYSLADPGTPARSEMRERLTSAARALGDWFDQMAVRHDEDRTWVTLDLRERTWSLFPCSEDLYAGVPGIAHFLGYLAITTGDARSADLASRSMRTLLRRLPHVADEVRGIGLFQGWGGLVYVLAHLGSALRDSELLEEGERLIRPIEERLERDRDLDVVGGAAGAASALLALSAASGSRRALDAAHSCAEHLLARATRIGAGLAWQTPIGGGEPQAGFAHGAAGIAVSLAQLADATGEARFRTAALAALAFERERLWPKLHRWLADDDSPAAAGGISQAERELPLSWCYGAPGIALSRLRLLRGGEDPRCREELTQSVALTLERGFGTNHCLCHGDLGNLEILHQSAALRPAVDVPQLDTALPRLLRAVLASIERDGWRCGTVAGVESPGLMNGLAGIGYGLLRLAAPEKVPSVLGMEPPLTTRNLTG